jgi:hypothetical protein
VAAPWGQAARAARMPYRLSLAILYTHWLVSFQFSPDEFCKIAGNQQTIFSFLSRPNLQFCRSLFSPVQPQTEIAQNTAVRALHHPDCSRLYLYLPRQYNSKAAQKKHKIGNHRSKIAIQHLIRWKRPFFATF